MKQHSECLVCQSSRLKPLPRYSKTFLVKCLACGFVFSKKIPDTEELEKHYSGYHRNDYLSPITVKRYHEILDKMEVFRKTNRIIDVGCGIGYFLDEAKKRGWEVYGTEYTQEAVDICEQKGILMHKGPLNTANYSPESFDIITSFEVIEHINNPLEEVIRFKEMLRPGGLVYITTPNFDSLLRYRLKEKYNVITYPEHLSYYTPKTIKRLFKNNGFKTQEIQTTGISLTRLRTSLGTTDEGFVAETSSDERLRSLTEAKWYLRLGKSTANSLLTFFGVGDSLKAWFIKK
ncbi:MAG: class I SAM-dependent methyltransferase [Brumimicrobium sp.]|nr:class I SAM-dependent methyltransferase [Brumimicrobium sp.]